MNTFAQYMSEKPGQQEQADEDQPVRLAVIRQSGLGKFKHRLSAIH